MKTIGKKIAIALMTASLCLIPLMAQEDEYQDVIEDSDAAVAESDQSLSQSESEVEQYDSSGELPQSGSQSSGGGDGIIYDNGTQKFANTNTKFALGAKDNKNDYESGVAKSEYRIDNDNWNTYSGPFQITVPGLHHIYYRSIDKAGNIEDQKVYKIFIDDTIPTVKVHPEKKLFQKGSVNYANPQDKMLITGNDNESGIGKLTYKLDNGGTQNYSNGVPGNSNGKHTIVATSYDNVGNASQPYTYEWVVDGVKPTAKIKISPPPKMVNGKPSVSYNTQFTVVAADGQSGIKSVYYRVNGSNWAPYSGPISFSKDQEFTIEAKAVDNVGNESVASEGGVDSNGVSAGNKVTFKVDKIPPETTLTALGSSTSGGGSTDSGEEDSSGSSGASSGGGEFDEEF